MRAQPEDRDAAWRSFSTSRACLDARVPAAWGGLAGTWLVVFPVNSLGARGHFRGRRWRPVAELSGAWAAALGHLW